MHLSIPHKTLFTACLFLPPFSSSVTYTAWENFTLSPPVAGIRRKKTVAERRECSFGVQKRTRFSPYLSRISTFLSRISTFPSRISHLASRISHLASRLFHLASRHSYLASRISTFLSRISNLDKKKPTRAALYTQIKF